MDSIPNSSSLQTQVGLPKALMPKSLKALSFLLTALVCIFSHLYTTTAIAQDEDGNLILDFSDSFDFKTIGGIAGRLEPHGNDLMGEMIDKKTGSITFEHTDISIPGNSNLEVALRRKHVQGFKYHTPHQQAFGDWVLDLPMAYFGYGLDIDRYDEDYDPKFRDGCIQSLGRVYSSIYQTSVNWGASVIFHSGTHVDGTKLNVPGKGLSGFGSQVSVNALGLIMSDPKEDWVQGARETDHDGRCAEVVIAPDGTKYKFGRHVYRLAEEMLVPTEFSTKNINDTTLQGYLWFSVPRKYAVLLVTEVEDVHGNWVRYEYADDEYAELQRIHSNDGREIVLHYDGSEPDRHRNSGHVSHITAHGRQWDYEYSEDSDTVYKTLHHVVLPDGRYWDFAPDGQAMRGMLYEPYLYWNCVPVDRTFSIKHPDGAIGTFTLRETRHLKSARDLGSSFAEEAHRAQDIPAPTETDTSLCNSGQRTVSQRPPEGMPFYRVMSLVNKTISASNIPTATWDFEYRGYTGGDIDETWSKITGPDGTQRKYIYSTLGRDHGLLKRIEANSASGEEEFFVYMYDLTQDSPENCQTPGEYNNQGDACLNYTKRPMTLSVHTRGGESYMTKREYNIASDGSYTDKGRPNIITRASSLDSGERVTEVDYWHNDNANIIGLTQRVIKNDKEFAYYGYNSDGTRAYVNKFGSRWETYAYHTDGNLKTITDPIGNTATLLNYFRGQPQYIKRRDDTTLLRSIDPNGWVTSETNARGYVTRYEYNDAGWMTLIDRPSPWEDTSITYSGLGTWGINSLEARGDYRKVILYDAMLRPILEGEGDVSTSNDYTYNKVDYDALGREIFSSFPYTSSSQAGIETTYDGFGRVIETRENVSPYATTTIEYLDANNAVRVTDPEGNVTTTFRSGYGSPDDGQTWYIAQPEGIYTRMSYDDYGNMVEATQYGGGNSSTQRWSYNDRLQVCRHYVPETGSKTFLYDSADRLSVYGEGFSEESGCVTSIPASDAVALLYDKVGRNTHVNYLNGTASVAKTYDENGNLRTLNRGGVNWTYDYNSLDLPTFEQLNLDGELFSIYYGYDSLGHPNSMIYPSGRYVPITTNALGQMTDVQHVKDATYHPSGSLKSMTYANGVNYSSALSSRQLPLSADFNKSSGEVVAGFEYDWDRNANLTGLVNAIHTYFSVDMDYDGVNRLISANSSWGQGTIEYDALGNIRHKQMGNESLSYSYDNRNRLNSVSGDVNYVFSYDGRGNVTHNGQRGFVFDQSNQLTSSDGVVFQYDGHNRRVKKTRSGRDDYFVYNQAGQLIHKRDGNGQITDYVYLGNTLVAKVQENTALSNLETQSYNIDSFQDRYRLQNYWMRDWYINIETGDPEATSILDGWSSGMWFFDVFDDYFRIQSYWQRDEYLHVENGMLASSAAPEEWHSAHWILHEVGDVEQQYQGQVYRIQNRWATGKFLNVENGELAASYAGPDYWSSYWILHNLDDPDSVGERVVYSHFDYLGSIVAETNEDGDVVENNFYMPFGENFVNSAADNEPGYANHAFDQDLNLNYMQARYYDPVIGRFLSNDPVGFIGHLAKGDTQGFNRYSYVGNNPYVYTDPDGRSRKSKRKQGLAVANLVAGVIADITDPGSSIHEFANHVEDVTETALTGKTRSSQMTQAKKDAKIPRSQRAESVSKVKMTDSNGNTVKNSDGSVVKTTEYAHTTTDGNKVVIQDHSAGHQDFGGDAAKPHLNVRPAENTRTGKVEGTKDHYIFDK